jgi:hypothetical protein
MTFDYSADVPVIEAYNARRSPESKTRLHTGLGPAPFDGNPFTAGVLLLMNNPGYDAETSTPDDHRLCFDGWPLAGLHPDAPKVFRDWYRRPLGHLIDLYGAQKVSRNVSIVQINPWASAGFDLGLLLPSRAYQFDLVRHAGERGAVIVIGRSVGTWAAVAPRAHLAKSVRNPRLSPNGLSPAGWAAVDAAMAAAN